MRTFVLFSLIAVSVSASAGKKEQLYRIFPQRTKEEAAVVEWGHSAIISALDGAVASFGPQTSQGASFEVETTPVLANPIDGVGKRSRKKARMASNDQSLSAFEAEYPGVLDNADDVSGNMVIMTDAAGLSGVTMARIAKESGAAALMVVNTDQNAADFIYSLEPETDEEREYAETNVDIPVIMVSLQAGNVITTAMATEEMDAELVNAGGGLPDRVRLYAGGDRPFFEDALSRSPLAYLIHNMLTEEECDELVRMAEGKYDRVDDASGVPNHLENMFLSETGEPTAVGVDRVTLWKGGVAGKFVKDIDERVGQVTGFPADHFADLEVNKFAAGASHGPHFDVNPTNGIMASMHIFLNDVPDNSGGEFVFTRPEDGAEPVVVRPRKGMAIVYHNTDEEHNFDKATLHEEWPVTGDAVKYVAKKYVYLNPQSQATRVVLPILAMPFGGKLPRAFVALHNMLVEKFGAEDAEVYFRKAVTMIPVALLLLLASIVSSFVKDQLGGAKGSSEGSASAASKKSSGDKEKKGSTKRTKSKSKKSD